MKNIFDPKAHDEFLDRINQLTPETKAIWGKMTVDQMLAHCNVTYEMAYENKYPKPTGIKKLLLKAFVKKAVVGPKAYPKNGRTAPEFVISDPKIFNNEKARLTEYLNKTQILGPDHFQNKESHSFGKLTTAEWNNMFSKHLDHHLRQFGV